MDTNDLIGCIREAEATLDVCTGKNSLGELEYKYISYIDADALLSAVVRVQNAEWRRSGGEL